MSLINRDCIQGSFGSGVFRYNQDPSKPDEYQYLDRINNCERGFRAWFKHLFHKNVCFKTTEGRIYVPITQARAIIAAAGRSGQLVGGERIERVFVQALQTHVAQTRKAFRESSDRVFTVLGSLAEAKGQVEQLTRENQEQAAAIGRLSDENKRVHARLEDAFRQVADLTRARDALTKRLAASEEELGAARSSLESLRGDYDRECTRHQREIADLSSRLRAAEAGNVRLQKELIAARDEVVAARGQHERDVETIGQQAHTIKELQTNLARVGERADAATKLVAQREGELEAARREAGTARKSVEEGVERLRVLTEQDQRKGREIEELRGNLAEVRKTSEGLTQEVARREEALAAVTREAEGAKRSVAELGKRVEVLTEQDQQKSRTIEELRANLVEAGKMAEAGQKALQREQQLTGENAKQEQAVKALEGQLDEARRLSEETAHKQAQRITALEGQLDEFAGQAKQREAALLREVEGRELRIAEQEAIIQDLQRRNAGLRKSLNIGGVNQDQARAALDQRDQDMDRLRGEVSSLRQSLAKGNIDFFILLIAQDMIVEKYYVALREQVLNLTNFSVAHTRRALKPEALVPEEEKARLRKMFEQCMEERKTPHPKMSFEIRSYEDGYYNRKHQEASEMLGKIARMEALLGDSSTTVAQLQNLFR